VDADADRASARGELLTQLAHLLKSISPASRAVLTLHYEAGLSLAEVAGLLDPQPRTVKSRLVYGLQQLRQQFDVDSTT
jgi:RNA polymerase sigma factor (sigma-70 family)